MTQPVYVIDDDPAACLSLAVLLETLGHETKSFHDGREFLQWWLQTEDARDQPACIILDYRLPELDGLAVLKKMKEVQIRLPVIMMTAELSTKVHQEAMSLGVLDILGKPSSCDRIQSALESAADTLYGSDDDD